MERERDPLTGQFVGSERSIAASLADLPKSNEETIRLYQQHGILPTKKYGIDLELRKNHLSRGDKKNDLMKLYCPQVNEYLPVRPKLNDQSKLDLKTTHHILYDLLNKDKHSSIAKRNGWFYYHKNGKTSYNNNSIKRIRSKF